MCLKSFEDANLVSCQLKEDEKENEKGCCEAKFTKSDGVFLLGKWFCKDECANKDSEIKRLLEMEK